MCGNNKIYLIQRQENNGERVNAPVKTIDLKNWVQNKIVDAPGN